jgi:hypothetical protein
LLNQYPFEALVQGVQAGLTNSRERLTQALKDVFREDLKEPSTAHQIFHRLSMWDGSRLVHRVFTTNFDGLLEKEFGARAESVTEANVGQMRRILRAEKIPIIHLHGTLDSGYQITEADVFGDRYSIVVGELRAALINADAFVFVGYSMSDPDFRRLYELYRHDIVLRQKADKKTYVVMPGSETSYRFGRVLWETRGAIWLPMTALAFFGELERFLEGHVQDNVRKAIYAKYSLTSQEAYDQLVARTAEVLDVEPADAIQYLYVSRTRGGV